MTSSGGAGSGAGGASGTGGSGAGGADAGNVSDVLVGSYQVEISRTSPTEGRTSIIGKMYSGPNPVSVKWNLAEESGDCVLETPEIPFCDPRCGADVCVDDDVCQPYPEVKVAGEVSVSGLKARDGSERFTLIEVNGSYQKPPAVDLEFPPFDEGDAVRFDAAGGDFAPFSLEATGVAPLVVESPDLMLSPGEPLELTWEPASEQASSRIHVKLDISHHGGTKGHVLCETADTGSLTISGSLISQLIELGVAGFPTILLSRRSVGSTSVPAGRVDLTIFSDVELGVGVPGVVSCNDPGECASGVCRADRTCEPE